MTTTRDDRELHFNGLSTGNWQALSILGVGASFGNVSLSNFTPLRTYSPQNATALETARFVATIAMDILQARK